MIQTKEKRTVRFIGIRWVQNCGKRFKKPDSDRLQQIYEGSSKTRFQYCQISKNVLLYIRATQKHTGENVIAPELMAHVAIPH